MKNRCEGCEYLVKLFGVWTECGKPATTFFEIINNYKIHVLRRSCDGHANAIGFAGMKQISYDEYIVSLIHEG